MRGAEEEECDYLIISHAASEAETRRLAGAARHDTVYIRGGCGRGVGCPEVSDDGGGEACLPS